MKSRIDVDSVDLLAPAEKRELLAEILKKRSGKPKIHPLSFAQEGLWFLHKLQPNLTAYNLPGALRLMGSLDIKALEDSLNDIIRRHDSLRTTFRLERGRPQQVIRPFMPIELPVIESYWLGKDERDSEALRAVAAENERPFDLSEGPLFRIKLLRFDEQDNLLIFILHHIISDAWSLGLLVKELTQFYRSHLEGASPSEKLKVQYADYVQWQRNFLQGDVLNELLSYWNKKLAGAPPLLEMPTDRPRPALQTFNGAQLRFEAPESLLSSIRSVGNRQGATLYMTLLAAFQTLLYRYSGQEDIIIGSPAANRKFPEFEPVMGFFVNTLVLRTDFSGGPTFNQLLSRVRVAALEAFQHQDMSFEKLVAELRVERSLNHNPLFQILFALQNAPAEEIKFPGLKANSIEVLRSQTQFDLMLFQSETENGLIGTFEYNTDLFNRTTVERLINHYRTLLKGIASNAEARVSELPVLTPAEESQLINQFNATAAALPSLATLHELFERQAELSPDRLALVFGPEHLSYGRLDARVNQVARFLQKQGIGPECVVGVCLERSIEVAVAILGILKAGGAYLPLDSSYPDQRLTYMVEDAGVKIVIGQAQDRRWQTAADIKLVELTAPEIQQESAERARSGASEANAAYLIYTSGSTGAPKGVLTSHQAICNRLLWMQQEYQLTPADRVLQKTPLGFDVSVWELFWPLITGACMVIARPGGHREGGYLVGLIRQQQVTTLHFVPSMLQMFLQEAGVEQCLTVKNVICSGEALTVGQLKMFNRRMGAEISNLYGPTEAAVDVTYWRPNRSIEPADVLIGKPIANTRIYVLDKNKKLVPIGVRGEICIGGTGLGRGYIGKPELTALKYEADGVGEKLGERIYRTGDIGRWRETGDVEYIGREDQQVKVRGNRVELGEIEVVLTSHPLIKDAVVTLRASGGADHQLIAYVVPAAGASPAIENLRSFLAEKLPHYMIPQSFMMLDALPLSANGKLDRKALPVPDPQRPELAQAYVAPRTPVERILADSWSKVLGIDAIGVYDNYFALGGDSIRSMQVLALAEEQGLSFTLQQLFKHQTIAGLAGEIALQDADRAGYIETEPFSLISDEDRGELPEDIEDAYPLNMLQIGMLIHGSDSDVYHNVTTCRVRAPFDFQAFTIAFQGIADRHPALRTSFDLKSFSEPLQLVHKSVRIPFEVKDVRSLSHEEQELVLARYFEDEKNRKLDLAKPPLLRFTIHRRTEETFQFIWTEHHAILDGWSVAAMIVEIFIRYNAARLGQRSSVDVIPAASFRDSVALERRAMMSEEDRRYWLGAMEGSSLTELPRWTLESAPAQIRRIRYHSSPISHELSDGLKGLAHHLNAPLKSVLLAAHIKALSLLSGQADVTTGLVTNGRPEFGHSELLLGLFLNTMPFRMKLGDETWEGFVKGAYEAEQDMLPHRWYPLPELQNVLNRRPLYETVFNFTHFYIFQELKSLKGIDVLEAEAFQETNLIFIVNFSQDAYTSEVELRFDYDPGVFPDREIEKIGDYYVRTLETMVDAPTDRHCTDYYLTPDERRQILEDFNKQRVVYATNRCLHELFEEQADRTPDNIALIFEHGRVTYRELDSRANRVARFLQKQGVGPERVVGVCLERSIEIMVAILGVLKAGGAYLPLDPSYPDQRLAYMTEDAGVKIVIGQAQDRRWQTATAIKLVELTAPEIEQESGERARSGGSEANAAYIIYTSGSTGMPKGVVISHRNVARLLEATSRWFEFGPQDVWTMFHSYAFDFSVWEMWGALLKGGKLVVVPYWMSRSPEAFYETVRQEGVTVLNQTPSAFNQLMEAEETISRKVGRPELNLRYVIFGGEALDVRRLSRWYERREEDGPQMVNMYGITETTVHVTYHGIRREEAEKGETGRVGEPIGDLQVYILDGRGDLSPVGVTGEMYVGGAGVARCYAGRGDLTAERFFPDGHGEAPGARLYRTGDLGRWSEGGKLEYLGRADQQIKIRGFRIELGEIEAALKRYKGARDAVVITRLYPQDDNRLVAYVVPEPDSFINPSDLRDFVSSSLPAYMVPHSFTLLNEFPLTMNGKLDYGALPDPDESRPEAEKTYLAPRTPEEAVLADLWAKHLKVDRVGVYDNFFELGGHSVLATKLITEVNSAFGIEMSLRVIFETPTIDDMAKEIQRAKNSQPAQKEPEIKPVARQARNLKTSRT